MSYHNDTLTSLFDQLHTSERGLSTTEVEKRIQDHGPNELPVSTGEFSRLKTFLRQFKSLLLGILVGAGVVSGLLGEMVDMVVIFITVVLNACVGYFQENKANQSLKKLRSMVSYKAVVLRDGVFVQVQSTEIVVGDILSIEAGDKVQADGRVISCNELQLNEAALTGESKPVDKQTGELPKDTVLAEQCNMVFRGTTVIRGKATVLITAIGTATQIGQIATLVLRTDNEETPLQRSLRSLSKTIALFVLLLCAGIIGLGLALDQGHSFIQLFQTAVAVAVAAIPEGLVISLTMILALGMTRILRRDALIRRLIAAETLGSVTVICTDKTGTITEGVMSVSQIYTSAQDVPFSTLTSANLVSREQEYGDQLFAIQTGILASDGGAVHDETSDTWSYFGDTTDTALLKAGVALHITRAEIGQTYTRIADVPFTSERKYMATLSRTNKQSVLTVKGAADVLLLRCVSVYEHSAQVPLTSEKKSAIETTLKHMIARGYRVLLIAHRDMGSVQTVNDNDVSSLTFVALVGITDPIRPDVLATIEKTKQAGIRTIMITGDHVDTARLIGQEVGIVSDGNTVFDGTALESMDDETLARAVQQCSVFARVNPVHKIRIVNALQKHGEVVAMTGDGVNDAPALKGADIGIALGSGTDVAKESADMVLLNDSFATIVEAIREGRGIFENIRKVILYLFSSCFTEVILIVGSLFFGLPLALLPVQILWINILQDSFPVMGLAFDSARPGVLNQPPRSRRAPLLDWTLGRFVVARTILCDVPLLLFFAFQVSAGVDISYARTMTFVGVACLGLFYIFSIRHPHTFIWQARFFDNKQLIGAVALGAVLIYLSTTVPFLQVALGTVELLWLDWLFLLGYGVYNICVMETVKLVSHFYSPKNA